MKRDLKRVYAENRLLRRLIKKFSDALVFYAQPETYFAIAVLGDPPCGDFVRDFSKTNNLGYKPGKRARRVLDKAEAEWMRAFPDAATAAPAKAPR